MRCPTSSWRYPVSMACWMTMRTSITSPRFASLGIWIRAAMPGSALVQAGGQRHPDFGGVGPEGAVGHLRRGSDALAARQAHARADFGSAGARAQVEARHMRDRVA